jgi:hypothetical protein
MPPVSQQPAPIRSVQGLEQDLELQTADLQWARDAAERIAVWILKASITTQSYRTLRVDVPKAVVHVNQGEHSRRARALVALLAHAGWSAAQVLSTGYVILYAARYAIEIVTDDGERFGAMHYPPDYSHPDIWVDLSHGARRGCADGVVEWIPRRRIHLVRYLNGVDTAVTEPLATEEKDAHL